MAEYWEYWLTEDDEIYCNGDDGHDVPNHAMVVVHHCATLLLDRLYDIDTEFSNSLAGLIQSHLDDDYNVIDCVSLRCSINDEIDNWVEDGHITQDIAEDVFEHIINVTRLDREVVMVAIGQHDDPREYGIKLGWIRVIGHNFDLHKINKDAVNRMYEFAVEHGSKSSKWSIEIHDFNGSRRFLCEIPTCDLEYNKILRLVSNNKQLV
jgi:hypothetical protein